MAAIPSAVEVMVDAWADKLEAEDTTATVLWVTELIDPERLPAEDWPTLNANHYQIAIVRGDGDPPSRQIGSRERQQVVDIITRCWTYSRSDAARDQLRHLRAVQNWAEELRETMLHADGRMAFDWTAWTNLRDESGQAPTPGADLAGRITVYE